jgi:hypothetical protein
MALAATGGVRSGRCGETGPHRLALFVRGERRR